jgi:lysine decarboxylase
MVYEYIRSYIKKGIYPFHMPGHKRNPLFLPPDLLSLDLTEIPDMDVLSEPTGILQDLQHSLAAFFGADESYLLINGSTAGIVAAICAVCNADDTLYAARNGHASMYNGMAIAGAVPEYFYPVIRPDGLAGGVDPDVFDNMPYGAKVFIVSPTYEGFTSDVAEIARRVHKRGGVLIVDEAHGAHFPFHDIFPRPALSLGADIVINSLHKTLPALGQTAVLHLKGDRVDRAQLRFYLNALQTTSPSYMLMASADYMLQMLWKTPGLFDGYAKRLLTLREVLDGETSRGFPRVLIRLLPNAEGDDPGKLLFYVYKDFPAEDVALIMAADYKIQVEMARGRFVLAMTSVADTDEGFTRLAKAVSALNERFDKGEITRQSTTCLHGSEPAFSVPEVVLPPRAAMHHPTECVPLAEAAGRIAGELIAPCPPGVALIAPGERIPPGLAINQKYLRVLSERRVTPSPPPNRYTTLPT